MSTVTEHWLHVCVPRSVTIRTVRQCPTCQQRRRMVGSATVWYNTIWTCCGCGDKWEDGERLPRPFTRGWRAESAERASREWMEAPPASEARAQLMELVEDSFA